MIYFLFLIFHTIFTSPPSPQRSMLAGLIKVLKTGKNLPTLYMGEGLRGLKITLGIMLEILNNYPWTRLSVRIIGAIKRQGNACFDNSNLSQEIFAIDT